MSSLTVVKPAGSIALPDSGQIALKLEAKAVIGCILLLKIRKLVIGAAVALAI